MARLYPPITEETLPAFCLTYNTKGEKVGATIKISFNLNRAVANSEISGIALRLRTISTNTIVVSENLNINPAMKQSEGIAISYDLTEGNCIFSITKEYNENAVEGLKIGQYYKAQLAFINNNTNEDIKKRIGYWSTVSVIKCVAEPTVKIANFHSNDINIFSNEIVGEYIQDPTMGDYTEKVYSYNFQLFDIDGKTVLEETGEKLHNSSQDLQNNASTDIYRCYRDLEENDIYYIQYNVKTVNGLKASSPKYQLMNIGSIAPEENIILRAFNGLEQDYNPQNCIWRPYEEGVMEIYMELANESLSKRITGNFVLLRSSSKNNFTTWQEVKRFRLNNEIPSKKKIYDYTIEQGIKYKYAIQQYNRQGFYSKKVYAQSGVVSNPFNKQKAQQVKAEFEDIFLYDGKRQLKIRFNPKVSSIKNSLQEQKIDTIGSKYPFIFRNGNICYKEFPISGLISFQEDNAQFFMTDEDYSQMDLQRFDIPSDERKLRYQTKKIYVEWTPSLKGQTAITDEDLPVYELIVENQPTYKINKKHEIKEKLLEPIGEKEVSHYRQINSTIEANELRRAGVQLYSEISQSIDSDAKYTDIYRGETYSKTDLTSDNIMSERYFKLTVLDWLTDGKPKLFKSPTEGNYIIRLLNVSLSPQDSLGRMLHTFSATAYEIAEFSYESLIEFGLLNVEEPSELETQWVSYNIKDLLKNSIADREGYYLVEINNQQIKSFSCTGFAPGDKIKLIISENSTPLIITIGQTGTYIYENAEPIISISILPQNNTKDFPRDLFFETLGYTYQKFDMIASINMKTQKGEQIVGKSKNIFEKTLANNSISQNKSYWTANNVYLSTDFKKVEADKINQKTYNKNTYYIYDNGKYVLPLTSTGEKADYNDSTVYYKKILTGEKLITTDILYLHAKRREVIPIFLNAPGSYYLDHLDFNPPQVLDNLDLNTMPYFMLTPFGNGYVRYKSISRNFNWNTRYGNLTEEERTKALTVHDLMEFLIGKCYTDKFCLFQVYVPHNTPTRTIWEPYDHNYYQNAAYCGIFDPYLYNIELEKNDGVAPDTKIGWWTANEIYTPSFYITYGEDTDEYTEEVSLQDNIEMTLKDIKMPTKLWTDNGIVMELFYRVKYIDYTIENERKNIKQAKQNYLQAKENAEINKSIYRQYIYFKTIGDLLVGIDNNNINAILNNADANYVATVKRLAELSRKAQIANIKRYLTDEQNLAMLLLNQISQIDLELIENLGQEISIFYSNYFISPKTKYEEYINNTIKTTGDELLPTIQQYETKKSNLDKTRTILQSYYNNIQGKNSNWNFINILGQVIEKLESEYSNIQKEILDLKDNHYVGQYLADLEDRGHQIFMNVYSIKNKIDEFEFDIGENSASASIGNWIKKKNVSGISNLKNYKISDSKWDEYFHITSDDKSLPLLGSSLTRSNKDYKYSIDNLEKYLPDKVQDELDIHPSGSKLYNLAFTANIGDLNKTESLILIIKDYLDYLNSLTGANTQSEYKNKWGIEWIDTIPKIFTELYRNLDNEDTNSYTKLLVLGNITNLNGYTISKSKLEQQIDAGFKENKLTNSSTISDIQHYLQSLYKDSFPDVLAEQLAKIVYQYISSGLRDQFQDIYDFYIYQITSQEELTADQLNFIQQQFINYQVDLTSENTSTKQIWEDFLNLDNHNSALYKFIYGAQGRTDIRSFEEWHFEWIKLKNKTSVDNITVIKNTITNYVSIFNDIVTEKNKAIVNFNIIRNKILNLTNNPNIKASDNIKTILFNEEISYYDAYNKLIELKKFFKTRLINLQQSLDYQGYLDFLNDYIQLLNNTEQNTIDQEYYKFLQQIISVRNMTIEVENMPINQDKKVVENWKTFLNRLGIAYRQIEETGRLS